jgi:hypothetical protein
LRAFFLVAKHLACYPIIEPLQVANPQLYRTLQQFVVGTVRQCIHNSR